MIIKTFCCNSENPIGVIDPIFSWKVYECEDKKQKAYRIIVQSTDFDLLWDSGTITAEDSAYIRYNGKSLKENTMYLWRVTVFTENHCAESAEASFITGIFDTSKLKWVTPREDFNSPIIYKTFELTNLQKTVTVNVCGLGFFELYINGKKVSGDLMNPVRTDYDQVAYLDLKYPYENITRKSVRYISYEVSGFLKAGRNTIAVWLGNGWYRQRERIVEGIFDYGNLLKMFLRLTNGEQVLECDDSWFCVESPILYDNLFYGEVYDARKKIIPDNLTNVQIIEEPSGRIEPQLCPTEKIIKTYTPVLLKNNIYDVGICTTGFAEIICSGNSGDTIKVYYAEELDEDGNLDYTSTVGYEKSDAKQVQTDTYILNGNGNELYMPRFVWHGYRYFKIVSGGNVAIKSVKAHCVCSDLKVRTKFESSNKLLNNIHKMFVHTSLTNIHGCVPMDCPHRERLGYTGDGELSSLSVMYNFDAYLMYRKWIDDILDSQNKKTGFVPHTAPFNGGGGGIAWGSSVAVVPWNLYMQYGDIEILKKSRPHIKKWVEYLKLRTENGIVVREENEGWALGDWCMPSKYPWSEPHPEAIKIPPAFVNTIYYIYCIDIYNKISGLIGEKCEYLTEREESVKALDIFYKDGCYAGNEQGANFFALFAGIPNNKTQVLENAIKRIINSNYTFDTGISGNKFMLDVMDRYGRNDVALKMMLCTDYPSFGYMIENGATTSWETWEGTGSKNHTAFSSCDSWFFYGLCGIKPFGGYKEFSIEPFFADELDYVNASIECEYGSISLKWQRIGDEIIVEMDIPFNTTAHVNLKGKKKSLMSGKYKEVLK